jgi:hypothetical protein
MSLMEVLHQLETHISDWSEDYSGWFCGITAEPEEMQRVAVGGAWLCYETNSELEARQLEIHLRQQGCEGVPNLGGEAARYIFVYFGTPQSLH